MRLYDIKGYRPDIDGLRAVAVLSVIAYHLNMLRLAPGGFVGVDIFFVISGYLIANILLHEIDARRFSVAAFYERRARRILPALAAVFVACMGASLFLSFPQEIRTVSLSVLTSLAFSSNVLFFFTQDYFAGANLHNPMLHTWSLSVEEQFYVFFPLLLVVLRPHTRKRRLLVLALIGAASFGLSTWQVQAQPEAAFYLLPSRVWELMLGAILAAGNFQTLPRKVAEGAGLLGLALIGASLHFLDDQFPFPGPAALAACLGAALLIYSGRSSEGPTLAARALSLPPVRFIGLISYSLYLWHWPIIIFVQQSFGMEGKPVKVAILAASIALATFSWMVIEKPFRTKPYRLTRRQTLAMALGTMFLLGLMAVSLPPLAAMLRPIPPTVTQLLRPEIDTESYTAMRKGECFLATRADQDSFSRSTCLRTSAIQRNYLIIGDSHAAHLWWGIQQTHPDINLMQATASGCRPLLTFKGQERCTRLMKYIFNEYIPTAKLDGIILSGRWEASELPQTLQTAAYLRRYANDVLIAGPIHEYRQELPRLMATALLRNEDVNTFIAANTQPERQEVDKAYAAAPWPQGVRYFSTWQAVLSPGCTPYAAPHVPVQFDYGHLTPAGASCVARQITL